MPVRLRRAVTKLIVDLKNLSKKYGAFTALDNVTLGVKRGEIFALLGPNGAGKTTLIGIVSGLVKRTSGEATVDGFDVTRDYQVTRRSVGLVPQEINFDPFFSVEEILRFQAGYFGVRLEEDYLVEILSHLGLLDKRHANLRTLSGGMKRRVLIAKAIVHRPKVLFLDEPTAGVDVELRRELWEYVRILRDRGTTIVLTTHYLEEAEELADRVGVIDHGKLLLVEDKTALLKRLGTRVLSLTLGTPLQSLPDVLASKGGRLEADGRKLVFTDRADEALGPKIAAVVGAGIVIRDVDVHSPRLEEVFLRVLGEKEPS